ncbi:hypothetical protein [Burkholderia ambifaria]|uniref:hypothetical protein n=1 Tax=Burkholderia ambifaria TaxID=152480 RepID=UPI000F80DECE|nr:hypothetical protein [Burkholderia ambifaria]
MIRFLSVHHDALNGTHLHICWTSYGKALAAACQEVKQRVDAGATARAPLFYDFGPGDSDLRRLDALPCWTQAATA